MALSNRERLKQYLLSKGLSYSKCGRRLDMDGVSIWRYVAGLRAPSNEVKKRMKRRLKFEWKEE